MGKHSVARHYLKAFSVRPMDKNPTLFVYEKGNPVPQEMRVSSISQSKKYWSDDVESFLTNKIENPANPILDKIRRQETISFGEKGIFAVYIANMIQRVSYWREKLAGFDPIVDQDLLAEFNAEMDSEIKRSPDHKDILEAVRKKTKERYQSNQKIISKRTYAKYLQSPRMSSDVGKILQRMIWQFLVCPESCFVTGDNPVFFTQDIGLTNVHSEVSFPLAPHLAMTASYQRASDLAYAVVDEQRVQEINRRTAQYSRSIYTGTQFEWILSFLQNG
jgi:hypothetical protein